MAKYTDEIIRVKEILSANYPCEVTNYGKLIRSSLGILLLKSHSIVITDSYLKFLAGIELIHNASLLHDDVIDNETIRRGEQNILSKYNSKTSILYGDILTAKSISLTNSSGYSELTEFVITAIEDMCKGELIQQAQIGKIPSLEDYLKKTQLKTSSLFEAMLKGLNKLSSEVFDRNIFEFIKNYSTGFQLKNDLDNVLDTDSDRLNGIYTAPYIFSDSETLTKTSLEKTVSLIDNYISDAIKSLSGLEDSIYKDELIGIVKCLKD